MYWTLKDSASQVECAMFRSDNQRLRFRVADGERVVVIGEYRGSPVGREDFTADFAHVWRLAGGRLTELRQITDTCAWPQGAA